MVLVLSIGAHSVVLLDWLMLLSSVRSSSWWFEDHKLIEKRRPGRLLPVRLESPLAVDGRGRRAPGRAADDRHSAPCSSGERRAPTCAVDRQRICRSSWIRRSGRLDVAQCFSCWLCRDSKVRLIVGRWIATHTHCVDRVASLYTRYALARTNDFSLDRDSQVTRADTKARPNHGGV